MDIAYDYITKGHHLEENAGEMIERRTRRVLEGHHLIEHSIKQADLETDFAQPWDTTATQ